MSFDFTAYLKTLYPDAEYTVTPLDGGLVNTTVRAKRTTDAKAGEPRSLILKHAPPYVAVAGPDLPFSQERQTVEAVMLSAFGPGNPLSSLPAKGPVTIPGVITHDPDKAVLAIEDLGALQTLWALLSPASASLVPEPHLEAAYEDIGARVGRLFAELHSASTSDVLSRDSRLAKTLTHNLTEKIVNDVAVEPLASRLREFNVPNAEEIGLRVKEAYAREAVLPRLCLGDFHPGSILASSWADRPYNPAPASSSPGDDQAVTVIDWEFARLGGQGPDGDMPQFLACLHCNLIALDRDEPAYRATLAVARGLVRAYARHADINGPESAASISADRKWELVRACLILYGRETINQAFERKDVWGGGVEARKTMVERGAWYVEMAGSDVAEMRQPERWDDLKMRDGGFLLGLFSLDNAA
ncbi:uncharacterized protein DNG_07565 [Cephalotrichum gorgonifer]|uniref:Aminoglycoside phosphotransferase domain-containing protein n=1 Tax=Cephalotrichum gorgonifer TaxID=2041049 RepID=A0AAE8N208_9PEZI|nr:uncharacterized protein DNG_07565 [Cephalotrichum gorgonifer]